MRRNGEYSCCCILSWNHLSAREYAAAFGFRSFRHFSTIMTCAPLGQSSGCAVNCVSTVILWNVCVHGGGGGWPCRPPLDPPLMPCFIEGGHNLEPVFCQSKTFSKVNLYSEASTGQQANIIKYTGYIISKSSHRHLLHLGINSMV